MIQHALTRHTTIAAIALVLGVAALFPRVAAAEAMSITGWAWSAGTDTVSGVSGPFMGWITMYNVQEDTDTGALSGYAWSSNLGWISFNAAHVVGCPSGECAPRVDFNDQRIYGWARACSAFANKSSCSGAPDPNSGGWDGWIALSGASFGLQQNEQCEWEGYAWGSAGIGAIKFGPLVGKDGNYGVKGVAGNAACVPLSTKPNLKATPITLGATTVKIGVPTTLSSTITNTGTVSTSKEFPVLFQIHPGSTPPATLAATSVKKNLAMAALASGASFPKTASHTFPTAGIWQVRACADMGTIVTNVIDESNEEDNCGNEWKTITVVTEEPEDPENPGECSTVGKSCTAVNNCGMPTPGSVNTSCNCIAIDPACGPGGPGGEGIPEVEITATPLRVPKEGITNVEWRATNVTRHCQLSSTPAGLLPSEALQPDAAGEVIGSQNVVIDEQTLLRLTCTWNTPPEEVSDQVIVNILPDFNEF